MSKIKLLLVSILLILLFISSSANGQPLKKQLTKTKAAKVTHSINKTINQGDSYTLPNSIKLTVKNKKNKTYKIAWNNKKLNTLITGAYIINGSIKELNENVSLKLTIKPKLLILSYDKLYDLTTQLDIPLLKYDGENNEELINIYDKWIYFYNDTIQGIYKMNLVTKVKTCLLNCKLFNSHNELIPIQIRILKNKLFLCYKDAAYIDADPIPMYRHYQDRYIASIPIDSETSSSDLKPIAKGKYITTYNDYVFFIGYNDYGIYRVNSDGANVTKIVDDDISFDKEQPYKIENGRLIYKSNSIYNKKDNISIANSKPDYTILNKNIYSHYPCSVYEKDGWIYYLGSVDHLVYRIKTDGTENQKLMDSKTGFTDLVVYNNYLVAYCTYTLSMGYYDEREVYCISTDDGKAFKLPGNHAEFIAGLKDWIIYRKDAEGIYKIKRDGTGLSKLNIDLNKCTLCSVDNNNLYYFEKCSDDKKFNIMKMCPDTDEITQVTSIDNSFFEENRLPKIFYVSEPWIYYTDNWVTYKLNLESNEKIKLCENINQLNMLEVKGEWIYYSSGTSVFKVNTNKPFDVCEVNDYDNQEFDTRVEEIVIDINK